MKRKTHEMATLQALRRKYKRIPLPIAEEMIKTFLNLNESNLDWGGFTFKPIEPITVTGNQLAPSCRLERINPKGYLRSSAFMMSRPVFPEPSKTIPWTGT